jgi:hypothetical protein
MGGRRGCEGRDLSASFRRWGERWNGPEQAGLLRATNRLAEAEPLMRRALAIFERSLGPEHPWTVTARDNLAGMQSP